MTPKIREIAEKLAGGRYRFLSDIQIGSIRSRYNATRDEVRTAAIMADRIRRQRQLAEGRNSFGVTGLVEIGAPIVLKEENASKPRRRKDFQGGKPR